MTNEEMLKVLAAIGAVDGRQFDSASVAMWRSVVDEVRPGERPFTYGEAWSAVPKWFAQNDGFMSPRALITQMRKAREDEAVAKHQDEILEDSGKGEPQPICREHDLKIMDCAHCCGILSSEAGWLHGDKLFEWAKVNVFRADSLVENMEVPF